MIFRASCKIFSRLAVEAAVTCNGFFCYSRMLWRIRDKVFDKSNQYFDLDANLVRSEWFNLAISPLSVRENVNHCF